MACILWQLILSHYETAGTAQRCKLSYYNTHARTHTGWSKKEDIVLQMETLSIVERFPKKFTVIKLTKFRLLQDRLRVTFSSHL